MASWIRRVMILTGLLLTTSLGTVGLDAADPGKVFGPVEIPRTVRADGAVLAPGTYMLHMTSEVSDGERWLEFRSRAQLAGRELATVIAAEQIGTVAKLQPPQPGRVRVDMLKGADYLRVWINDAGTHYLMHLPLD